MVIDIYDGAMPLGRAETVITLHAVAADGTGVEMRIAFTLKFGLLGALMVPMLSTVRAETAARIGAKAV